LVLTVLVIAATFFFILRKVIDARRRPYAAGEEAMVGTVGTVREPLNPGGLVFVDGALWQATASDGPLAAGTPVRVVAVDGLRLRVEPIREQPLSSGEGSQAAS
jgi:membrane-bound serine protease (ClpP class)